MSAQIITTPNGDRLVILPEAEYERLREAAEMTADVIAYDRAKRRLADGDDELVPMEIVDRLLAGDNPIRVWREYRGLSLKRVAEKIGIAQPYLSQMETGKRAGTVETLSKIAAVLGVSIDDLVDQPSPSAD